MSEYKVGQRYRYIGDEHSKQDLILAQVDFHKIALITLRSGNRWSDPVEVQSPLMITRSEWRRITNDEPENFTLITKAS